MDRPLLLLLTEVAVLKAALGPPRDWPDPREAANSGGASSSDSPPPADGGDGDGGGAMEIDGDGDGLDGQIS